MRYRLKILLKRFALTGFACLGYLLLLHRKRKKGVRILLYHSINPLREHEVNVLPEYFYLQIGELKKKYRFYPLNSLPNIMDKEGIIITFDDGYHDNYLYAFPYLSRNSIPFTIFLTASYIGTSRLLPHDRKSDPEVNRLLSWEEVKEMSDKGVEFGSHGFNHIRFSGIDSATLREEIRLSKEIIEKNLGTLVKYFAFPYGKIEDIPQETENILRESGYTMAFTAQYGIVSKKDFPFSIKRIGVEASDTLFTINAKINGALDLLALKETKAGRILLSILNRLLGVS
ncbi:polysaccharide deacetylase family protein [Candidatus Calescamantes bacterium]|nr:polysaccharide deacetylase family protein [Candidatus Calescamantes bacterium]